MKLPPIAKLFALSLGLAITHLGLIAPQSAEAGAINWTGITTGTWGDGTNWSASAAPTSGDDLTILGPGNVAGALTINVAAAAAANSINFTDTSAVSLVNTTSGANQTLTLNASSGTGITVGTGAVTIGSSTANQNVNIALGASQTWNIGSGGLTVTNVISGSGFGLTKAGTGALILSGANTFSGGVTINAGTLTIGASSTPTSGAVTSGPLGTGTLTLGGGALSFNGASTLTVANAITATASTTTNVQTASGQNEVLNGNLTGSGNINHQANGSTGQLQWGGDNSGYSGTYTQGGGNTSLGFNAATAGSASANWVFNNGTSQRTRLNFGNGTISFGSMAGSGNIANVFAGTTTGTMSVGALNTNTTFSGVIADNGNANIALTKVGTGTLTLSGANTYDAGTTISNGTLQFAKTNSTPTTGAISVGNGATLAVNAGAATGEWTNGTSGVGTIGGLFSAQNSLWSYGLSAAETLFDGGARKAQVESARAAYDQTVDKRQNPADPQGPLYHTLRVFLIDREGRIRNIYSSGTLDPRLVVADVKTLLLEESRVSKQ